MNNKKTYKIETCHSLDAYITTIYKLTEEDLQDYINWCRDHKYNVDKEDNLLEYLSYSKEGVEELTAKNTWFENASGLKNALTKCKQIE